jgi:hypothetical protein
MVGLIFIASKIQYPIQAFASPSGAMYRVFFCFFYATLEH